MIGFSSAAGCSQEEVGPVGLPMTGISVFFGLGLIMAAHMAVAEKTGAKNGTLVSGNMDQNLRNPSWLTLSHTHMFQVGLSWWFGFEPLAFVGNRDTTPVSPPNHRAPNQGLEGS